MRTIPTLKELCLLAVIRGRKPFKRLSKYLRRHQREIPLDLHDDIKHTLIKEIYEPALEELMMNVMRLCISVYPHFKYASDLSHISEFVSRLGREVTIVDNSPERQIYLKIYNKKEYIVIWAPMPKRDYFNSPVQYYVVRKYGSDYFPRVWHIKLDYWHNVPYRRPNDIRVVVGRIEQRDRFPMRQHWWYTYELNDNKFLQLANFKISPIADKKNKFGIDFNDFCFYDAGEKLPIHIPPLE